MSKQLLIEFDQNDRPGIPPAIELELAEQPPSPSCILVPFVNNAPRYCHGPESFGAVAIAILPLVEKR